MSILLKGRKSSVIVHQQCRLVGLRYIAKEVLQIVFGKGIQHRISLLLLRQKPNHQATEAPKSSPQSDCAASCSLPVESLLQTIPALASSPS